MENALTDPVIDRCNLLAAIALMPVAAAEQA
jgi:hypothetical protein